MSSAVVGSKTPESDDSKTPENSLFVRGDALGAGELHSPDTVDPHPCFRICGYDSSKLTNKKLEVLTGERQSHGLIFEDRMCVYICKEMIEIEEEKLYIKYTKQEKWERIHELFLQWQYNSGMTDPFDIDFGSGVAGSKGDKPNHFVEYSKTVIGKEVITEMIERYGIGISVKVTGLTKTGISPIDMGDIIRISTHFDSAKTWSLIVGGWVEKYDLMPESIKIQKSTMKDKKIPCKCIKKVYVLKNLNVNNRPTLFGTACTADICSLVHRYWGKTGNSPESPERQYTKYKPDFDEDRNLLKETNSITIHIAPKSDKRCQCTINNKLFDKLFKENNGTILDQREYKHLYKPIFDAFKKKKKGGIHITSDAIKKIAPVKKTSRKEKRSRSPTSRSGSRGKTKYTPHIKNSKGLFIPPEGEFHIGVRHSKTKKKAKKAKKAKKGRKTKRKQKKT
jgi:hypothetical protein